MVDFLLSPSTYDNVWFLIVLTGIVTYITRSSGHFILSRFKTINPRVEAALEAVPAAVLVTLVIPPLINEGPIEVVAMMVALLASFRLSPIYVLALGISVVIIGRALIG